MENLSSNEIEDKIDFIDEVLKDLGTIYRSEEDNGDNYREKVCEIEKYVTNINTHLTKIKESSSELENCA